MNRVILDITDFIFMNDAPQESDVILVPGTSHAEITEKAAQLYRKGYANYVLPSGRFFLNTEILVIPTETQGITANGWYRNEKTYKKVLKELAKCGVYFSELIERLSSTGEV